MANALLITVVALTGEEDDETIYQVRGKLYTLVDHSGWKERGTGLMKVNVRQTDGSGARLCTSDKLICSVVID